MGLILCSKKKMRAMGLEPTPAILIHINLPVGLGRYIDISLGNIVFDMLCNKKKMRSM